MFRSASLNAAFFCFCLVEDKIISNTSSWLCRTFSTMFTSFRMSLTSRRQSISSWMSLELYASIWDPVPFRRAFSDSMNVLRSLTYQTEFHWWGCDRIISVFLSVLQRVLQTSRKLGHQGLYCIDNQRSLYNFVRREQPSTPETCLLPNRLE